MRAALRDLRQALGRDEWPPVILIAGDDAEARQRALNAVVEALPEEDRRLGVERLSEAPAARVLDAVRTAPLLWARRLVVAQDFDWLSAGGDEAAQRQIEAFVRRPPPNAVLVLVAAKADRRLAVVKAIEERGFALDCSLPREREMPAWVAERGRERGLSFSPEAAQCLADAVGVDTGRAARELDKLALLTRAAAGAPAEVDLALVEQALGPQRAAGAFALEDALLAGRAAPALTALERQLAGAPPGTALMVLGRLAAVARRLALAAGVVARGGGAGEVREALGSHPYVAEKYARAARVVGHRAAAALAACVAADGRLKSGGDPSAALAGVVLALTEGGGRS